MSRVTCRLGLIIPDCHGPHVHKPSWDLMIKVAKDVYFNDCVILGDFLNMSSVSSHGKTVEELSISLRDEIEAGNAMLDELDDCGFERRKYLEGNHEAWLGKYLAEHPALIGSLSLPDALGLARRQWKWIPYRSLTRVGKAYFAHDFDNAGKAAHTQAHAKLGANVVIGHTHRMAYNVVGKIGGRAHVAAMFGWLGDPAKITYRSLGSIAHEWTHGFGVYMLEDDGTIHLEPCPIITRQTDAGKIRTVKVFGSVYS